MLARKHSFIQTASFLMGVLILLIAFSIPATVYADSAPPPDNGNCITCHEDLYFLHDTGNWFCLKESPMACVDCHGGDPNTLDKALAHTKRTAHPILNDNVTKCMQCHPEKCNERVGIFDQTAGISEVLVAVPYTPAYSSEVAETIPVTGQNNAWLNFLEAVPFLLVAGLAVVIYIVLRRRRA